MIITPKVKRAIHMAIHTAGKLKMTHGDLHFGVHVIEAMFVLVEHGETDETLLCATALHDCIEDMSVAWTYDSIRNKPGDMGDSVADIVSEVTDDVRLPRVVQLELQVANTKNQKSLGAIEVKLADRISNFRACEGHRSPSMKRIDHTIELMEAAKFRLKILGINKETNHPAWRMLATLDKLVKKYED
ncbi:MAG: HD domain-containing protein [Nitrososphaera sp.]|nr:HD domain-containing protein [Nitrososphaera sp.]